MGRDVAKVKMLQEGLSRHVLVTSVGLAIALKLKQQAVATWSLTEKHHDHYAPPIPTM